MKPLLNIDGGELDTEADELYRRVTRACVSARTRVGAHPSYEDLEGFGRRARDVTADVLVSSVAARCARLQRVAVKAGTKVVSAKLHGALYHAADADDATARACVAGVLESLGPVTVVGSAGGALERATLAAGARFQREAFADRGVRDDGSLIPRGQPGALVDDPGVAAARAAALVLRGDVDTICIHADTPSALLIARAVREALGPKP